MIPRTLSEPELEIVLAITDGNKQLARALLATEAGRCFVYDGWDLIQERLRDEAEEFINGGGYIPCPFDQPEPEAVFDDDDDKEATLALFGDGSLQDCSPGGDVWAQAEDYLDAVCGGADRVARERPGSDAHHLVLYLRDRE